MLFSFYTLARQRLAMAAERYFRRPLKMGGLPVYLTGTRGAVVNVSDMKLDRHGCGASLEYAPQLNELLFKLYVKFNNTYFNK
jgi:hypothetical protein